MHEIIVEKNTLNDKVFLFGRLMSDGTGDHGWLSLFSRYLISLGYDPKNLVIILYSSGAVSNCDFFENNVINVIKGVYWVRME